MAFRYGGERLLTRVIRKTLRVEIDHFVEVDFHGFKDIVQDLGGVWFPVDQRHFNLAHVRFDAQPRARRER